MARTHASLSLPQCAGRPCAPVRVAPLLRACASDCSCRLGDLGAQSLQRHRDRLVNRKRVQVLLGEVAPVQERSPGVLADCRQMGIVAGEIGKDAGSVAVSPTDLIGKALLHGSRGSQPEQKRAFRRLLLRHAVPVPRHRFRCRSVDSRSVPVGSDRDQHCRRICARRRQHSRSLLGRGSPIPSLQDAP